MHAKPPQLGTPAIRRYPGLPAAKDCDRYASVALLTSGKSSAQALPFGELIAARMRRAGYKLGADKPFVVDLPNKRGTRAVLAGLKTSAGAFERLTLARRLIGACMEQRSETIALAADWPDGDGAALLEALLAAALAADFALPDYKSASEKPVRLREVALYGPLPDPVLARALAGARGNNLARYLTALPPNALTPGTYRRRAEALARAHGWRSEFLDLKKLHRLGAGAFAAVAQGSPDLDAGILRLRYAPRTKAKTGAVALVGKGICFDTGGVNLKSAKYMHGMHEDMEGSAIALGALLALSELKVDFPVDCWLALAQNHIGPKAYRPNEVVTAANGTTIEVVHTDAEGRMVLADTLALAAREKPKLVIDYATLTGACIGALGTRMSGAFTNRDEWIAPLTKAGEASGERVWPFPLPDDYEELLKSDVADIKQCALENEADQILAALFLRKFVPPATGWIHLDLAAGNNKGGLGHIPTDVTGFGVRLTLNLLLARTIVR